MSFKVLPPRLSKPLLQSALNERGFGGFARVRQPIQPPHIATVDLDGLSQDGKTYFLKLHAPYSILKKHAEVLNIKRPIKSQVESEQNHLSRPRFSIAYERHLQTLAENGAPFSLTTVKKSASGIKDYNIGCSFSKVEKSASSSPVPLKTRRVGQRCTLNLSRAETSSRWCGVVVRRGGASSGVVHVT
ncbi:uncharacterized protein TNCV_4782331 [Trichonephila clavipes]|nr:uncharacterized protein TNCV_4782331 [Trichonephila clavipes]